MADRPKKKVQSGLRNDERKCGKAPKKHPKPQNVLSDEQRAERDRLATERRAERDRLAAERRTVAANKAKQAAKRAEVLQKRRLNRLHEQAIVMDREIMEKRIHSARLAGISSLHAMAVTVRAGI